jgi:hypothetical protein
VAVLVVAGAGLYLTRGLPGVPGRSTNAGSDALWAQYFVPARDGYTCTYVSQPDIGLTANTASTQKVTDVKNTGAGLVITVRTDVTLDVVMGDLSRPGMPTVGPTRMQIDQSYTIAADGTLHAPPFTVAAQVPAMSTSAAVVYPSVEDLRAGKTRDTTVTASMNLPVGAVEPTASSSMRISETIRIGGADPKTITTPSGTYTDVVGVTMTILDLDMSGIPGLGPMDIDTLKATMPAMTMWYARGVGPVRFDISAGPLTSSVVLTGCTG